MPIKGYDIRDIFEFECWQPGFPDLKISKLHGLFIEKLQRQAYPLFDWKEWIR